MPSFKNDKHLIIAQAVVILGLFGLFYAHALTWPQALAAIALLQFPSLFGRKGTS